MLIRVIVWKVATIHEHAVKRMDGRDWMVYCIIEEELFIRKDGQIGGKAGSLIRRHMQNADPDYSIQWFCQEQ